MPQIIIHETTDPEGELIRTRLANDEGRLALVVDDDDVLPLPEGAVEAVMKRYGKPMADPVDPKTVAERLELAEGRALVRFRFMARYDVIARDYLALYAPGAEPVCELATSVTAALDHLARRYSATAAGQT